MFTARIVHLPSLSLPAPNWARLDIHSVLTYIPALRAGPCRVFADEVYRHSCMGLSVGPVWLCGRAHVVPRRSPTRNTTCRRRHGSHRSPATGHRHGQGSFLQHFDPHQKNKSTWCVGTLLGTKKQVTPFPVRHGFPPAMFFETLAVLQERLHPFPSNPTSPSWLSPSIVIRY